MIDIPSLKNHIEKITLPYLSADLVTAKVIKKIEIKGNHVLIQLQLGFPIETIKEKIIEETAKQINAQFPTLKLTISLTSKIAAHAIQPSLKRHPKIKNTIAIASGKGGVGKSTTAVNLALALSQLGAQVGILDADIYGPNQPQMLGVKEKPTPRPDKKFDPVLAHGIQSMSIGYLINTDTPMVWRGPMVSGALQQLVRDTLWEDLDYLLIDLPPGTGDIQLTLAQKVPVSGAVIVTTPQDIALLDARKGLEMFRKVNIPVLGIIENMSTYTCPQCGHEALLFGEQGGDHLAQETDVPLLGRLPLKLDIRQAVDQGNPSVISSPDSQIAENYKSIALRICAKLSLQLIDYTSKFPSIVVE